MPSSLLQSRVPAISFSSSLSSSSGGPKRRPSTSFPTGPRLRSLTVHAKIREIFMPALSSTMTDGKIVSWVKSEGDVVSKGESVVVVESDKADMDVETFYDGILASIVVGEGETAAVGAPIGLLAETEEEIAEAKAKTASSSSQSASSAPPTPPSSIATAAAATPLPPSNVAAPAPTDRPRKIVVTPFAKNLAKQCKVDINSVVGTGPFGRITPEDIEAAAGIAPSKSITVANVAPAAAATSVPADAVSTTAVAASYSEIPGSIVVPFTTMQAAVSKIWWRASLYQLSGWDIL